MSAESSGILVIRGGAIGDFILSLPVLAALRAQFPDAHLTVLGYPHIARLAEAGGLADEVRSIESRGLAVFFNPRAELPDDWRRFFAGFAVVISYLFDPDGFFQESVRRCTQAVFIAGPHRPDDHAAQHASEVLLQPLAGLAIFDADPVPRLRIPAIPVGEAPPCLALHPGSGSDQKNWPEARWAGLVQRLVDSTGMDLALVGGEAEGDRLERLAKLIPRERVRVWRSLPLPQLAGELTRCTALIGHDSGITHLAAAVGRPVMALWGPTPLEVWRPRGERVRIVHESAGLEALSVDCVARELAEFLAGLEGA